MNKEQIIEKLKQANVSIERFAFEDCNPDEIGLNWKEIDQYGGEGEGNTWYSIKYFPEYNLYLKVEGFYQSHNGTDFYDGWDSITEVKPVAKTITVYE